MHDTFLARAYARAGGYVFGPTVGAGLSEFSLATPMFASAGVAFANLLLAMFVIRETNPVVLKRHRSQTAAKYLSRGERVGTWVDSVGTPNSLQMCSFREGEGSS